MKSNSLTKFRSPDHLVWSGLLTYYGGMLEIHTIASFAKLQPDTLAAIFLLRKFGAERFPGVQAAQLVFWTELPPDKTASEMEIEGYLLIDLGHGQFDHHTTRENGRPTQCASGIIAQFLGVDTHPALQKLLAYAKRDDLEGKGTVSADPLDRAFGLSGLLVNLNRSYAHDLPGVANMVLAMFEAHYQEEENRTIIVKQEWKEIQENGRCQIWNAPHRGMSLRVVQLNNDNPSMAGFLRSYAHFDLVILRRSTGHVNLISNQQCSIDMSSVAGAIRAAEAQKLGLSLHTLPPLNTPGRLPEIPQWYYDTMANTLQNGGIQPQDTPATQLTDTEIREAVLHGLRLN